MMVTSSHTEYQGVYAFGSVIGFSLSAYGCVALLHGYSASYVILSIVGALLGICCAWVWLRQLWILAKHPINQAQHKHKLKVALWLIGYIVFAFIGAFLMIPLYYLINGGMGHAHGGQIQGMADHDVLPLNQLVQVYTTQDLNNDHMPVRVQIKPAQFQLKQGQSQTISIKLINPLTHTVHYRLQAKVVPSSAQDKIHYSLSSESISIPAQSQKELTAKLHIDTSLPSEAKTITLAHFLFAKRGDDDWKKMQQSWHHP